MPYTAVFDTGPRHRSFDETSSDAALAS